MAGAGAVVSGMTGAAGGLPPQPTPSMIGPGGPVPQVAETPLAAPGRPAYSDVRGRGRDASRDRRDGSRGRSMARRREGSYDPRGASCSTNRSRSASAFRDRHTGELLDDPLYSLSKILVKLCRHDGATSNLTPSVHGWFHFGNTLARANLIYAAKQNGGEG